MDGTPLLPEGWRHEDERVHAIQVLLHLACTLRALPPERIPAVMPTVARAVGQLTAVATRLRIGMLA